MQLQLNSSALIPKFNLKPALLFSLSGVSGACLYSSLVSFTIGENKETKDIFNKVVKPFDEVKKHVGVGTSKIYSYLSIWAREVANRKDKVSEWIGGKPTMVKLSNGTKTIFTNLKNWAEEIFKFTKDKLPDLIENLKKIESFIKQFFPLFWKAISISSIGGDTPIIKKLFDALGDEKFGDFTSALNNISDKKPDALTDLSEEETGNILSAFKNNPEKAVEVMKNFAEDGANKNKDDLLNSLKPYYLEQKIIEATAKAKVLIEKGSSMSSEEKKEAKEVYENLIKLKEELQKTIQEAQKKLKK